jgi:hypothetical protein
MNAGAGAFCDIGAVIDQYMRARLLGLLNSGF